ncbi:MAG: DUF1559 domain-containing protein [Thermofilaceae archaeon]
MQTRAFTLIELLTTIAIILLVAALLFPVVSQARETGRKTSCLAHTRQIGIAVQMYLSDYNETFPMNRFPDAQHPLSREWGALHGSSWNWKRALLPYLQSVKILECPSNNYLWSADFIENYGGEGGDESNWAWALKLPISYAYNGSFFHESIPIRDFGEALQRPRYLAEIPEPSWLILLTETRVNYPDLGGWALTQELALRTGIVAGRGLLNSHQKGVNWVFCDGSAKWLKVGATCVPRQRWTPYDRDQPIFNERARNLVEEYK